MQDENQIQKNTAHGKHGKKAEKEIPPIEPILLQSEPQMGISL